MSTKCVFALAMFLFSANPMKFSIDSTHEWDFLSIILTNLSKVNKDLMFFTYRRFIYFLFSCSLATIRAWEKCSGSALKTRSFLLGQTRKRILNKNLQLGVGMMINIIDPNFHDTQYVWPLWNFANQKLWKTVVLILALHVNNIRNENLNSQSKYFDIISHYTTIYSYRDSYWWTFCFTPNTHSISNAFYPYSTLNWK